MPSVLSHPPKQVQSERNRLLTCSALRPVVVLLLVLSSTLITARSQTDSNEPVVAQQVPAWMDQAIFYEIFPRAFSPSGTINGVAAELDRLQNLGVNVLWLMPIHPMGKTHRLGTYGSVYAVSDYYAINPDLGTKADLQRLVQAAHERHMRVILDEVPDHTAWDSVMMSILPTTNRMLPERSFIPITGRMSRL